MAQCDVKINTISFMKDKGLLDDNMTVVNPLFYPENARLSNLAREKYDVRNKQQLFLTETRPNDTVKAVPNELMFRELQDRKDNPDQLTAQEVPDNEEIIELSTEEILSSLLPSISTPIYKSVFEDNPMGALKEIYDQATSSPSERDSAVKAVGQEIVDLAIDHYAPKEKVTIKSSLSEDGEVYSSIIRRNRKQVGEIKSINDGEYLTVTQSEVTIPKQGIGTAAYERLAQEADLLGLTLRSDSLSRLSVDAIGLWESFVRKKKALKIGNHYYYGDVSKPTDLPPIIPEC